MHLLEVLDDGGLLEHAEDGAPFRESRGGGRHPEHDGAQVGHCQGRDRCGHGGLLRLFLVVLLLISQTAFVR